MLARGVRVVGRITDVVRLDVIVELKLQVSEGNVAAAP